MRAILSLAVAAYVLGSVPAAPPPAAPAPFDQPQTPAKPTPFPIHYVDQGTFDPRLKGLLAPEGFRVELVADAPTIINPVAMTFAPDGTLFVAEWTVDPVTQGRWFEFKETFRYRDGSTKLIATMRKFVPDFIKVLKFNPAKGEYDKFETIISDELPSTLLYHDGWLYTASRGTVRRYKQSRPNGPWDIREIIAQGFCGFHHHQVSGLTIGNDGKLYITSGDDDNFAEGSDGSRATVMRTGAVFRCNPDGSQLEEFSIGYRNPYRDIAYDDKFNFFHADNDNEDGSKFTGCRLVHVLEGVDYGWRLRTGARCCRPDFTRGAIAGELPGKLPPMLKTGRGSPAGLLIYHDTKLPEQYRGLLYYPDVFRKTVRAYKVKPIGSTFEITNEFEFLKSEDPLFRPCQMVTGPDGAIYVCDWRTDSGGAGRLSGDGIHGRIYRMKWVGTPSQPAIPLRGMDSWAKIQQLPDEQLVRVLGAPDLTDRVIARKELIRRGPKSRDQVLSHFVSGTLEPNARLAALGVLEAYWTNEVEDFFRLLLNDRSEDVRRLAADGLGQHAKRKDIRVQETLLKALTDDSPSVQRAVALAIGRVGADGAADVLVNAWKADATGDAFLTDGYMRAIESLGKPGIDALLAVSRDGNQAELARVVRAFQGFRTKPAANALGELLSHPHLTAVQRADLIRSYPNYLFDPPMSMEPLAEYLTAHPETPPEVKVAGLEVLTGTGSLDSAKANSFVLSLLDAKEAEVRMAAIQTSEEIRFTPASGKLLGILADSKRPLEERLAALKAVRSAGTGQTAPALLELLGKSEPATLKVEALRALAAVAPEQAKPVATKLLDQPDPMLLTEAVLILGATKDGAKLVGERFVAKKLPRDLLPRVSEVLGKFASDPAIAKLSGEAMKGGLLLATDPASAERVRKLVFTKGDPKKGKELYLNTALLACASCHRMEGSGGSVGPDLTRVWDTQTVEKILEAIVEPSKEIKEGYQTYKATTLDGRVFTGLRISESATEVLIREANGRDVRIPKTDLDELSTQKTSLMPDNVVSQLTFDQFIDLLAFLKSRSAQESLRGGVLEFAVNTGNFLSPTAWKVQPTDPNGILALKPLLPAKPTTAYALTWIYSPTKQTAKAALFADDPAKVWLWRVPVFQRAAAKSAPFTQEESFTVDLPAGWSPLLVQLEPTGATHRLGLTLQGEGLRTSAKPDVK